MCCSVFLCQENIQENETVKCCFQKNNFLQSFGYDMREPPNTYSPEPGTLRSATALYFLIVCLQQDISVSIIKTELFKENHTEPVLEKNNSFTVKNNKKSNKRHINYKPTSQIASLSRAYVNINGLCFTQVCFSGFLGNINVSLLAYFSICTYMYIHIFKYKNCTFPQGRYAFLSKPCSNKMKAKKKQTVQISMFETILLLLCFSNIFCFCQLQFSNKILK